MILDARSEGPIPATRSRYIIGMPQANRAEPWREMMDKQIAEAAQEYPQFAVIFADARQDNAKQVADVRNFMALNIDLLIVSPNEAEPLTGVIGEAYQHCIPVIVLGRAVNGDQFSMFIGANNVSIGRLAAGSIGETAESDNIRFAPRLPMEFTELL